MPKSQQTRYVKAAEAEKLWGVERRTLFRLARSGQIPYLRPGGKGHWLFDSSVLLSSTKAAVDESKVPIKAIYARVSTRKQLPNLKTQIQELEEKYPDHVVFSDCASGLNFKRKGLQSLLQLAFERRLQVVRIAHRDCLCRFAYDLIEHILQIHGAKIVVEADDMQTPTAERELADDIISIITVFGARLHGSRSGAAKKKARQVIENADFNNA
jgi:predicted site-specific integrase-resolvase